MKIVLVGTVASYVLGFRSDLIRALLARGATVYAFAVDYDDKSRAAVRTLGAEPVDYKINRAGMNPVKDLLHTISLSRKLKAIAPDVVLVSFAKPVIFGSFAAKLAGVRRVIGMVEGLGYSFTEQPGGFSKKASAIRWVQTVLYKLSLPLLERVIFLNADDVRDLVERNRIKYRALSLVRGIGVNLDVYGFSRVPGGPCRFIFVGRFLREKGVNEFIEAARQVKELEPAVEFVMLGTPDTENPGGISKQRLSEFVAEGLVQCPGQVSNVSEWMQRSHVFVLPSYREGIPRSTQEAMSVGRAVLTTDVPGCRETVIDGANGFLVPRWSADELAKKMLLLARDRAMVERMGQESRRLAEQWFDVRNINSQIISFIYK